MDRDCDDRTTSFVTLAIVLRSKKQKGLFQEQNPNVQQEEDFPNFVTFRYLATLKSNMNFTVINSYLAL